MNRLLLRLLRRHISPLQLLGFSLANFVGVAIILLGIQFYQDARSSLEAKDKFMKGDYIILSKRVGGLALFGSEDNTFSDREIKELEEQSFGSVYAVEVSGFSWSWGREWRVYVYVLRVRAG